MPEDRTVLDHLLEGRDALQREVERLTAAIEQLDSVLGRLGTMSHRSDGSATPAAAGPVAPQIVATEPVAPEPVAPQPVVTEAVAPEPVNPPAEVEAPPPVTVRSRPRATRKPPARKSSRPRVTEAPKSIRVHVLEMLQSENREFGLAEIIDRVHDAGIQAHDDAVRSITIKLMKDGRVERVGRGQYRLARRGSATRVTVPPPVGEPVPAPLPVATDPLDADASIDIETSDLATTSDVETADPETIDVEISDPETTDPDTTDAGTPDSQDAPEAVPEPVLHPPVNEELAADDQPATPPYTPSLNLGQPWNS